MNIEQIEFINFLKTFSIINKKDIKMKKYLIKAIEQGYVKKNYNQNNYKLTRHGKFVINFFSDEFFKEKSN